MNQLLDLAGNALAQGDMVLATDYDGMFVARISAYNPGNMYCSLGTVQHKSIRTRSVKRFKLTQYKPSRSSWAAGADMQTYRLLRMIP